MLVNLTVFKFVLRFLLMTGEWLYLLKHHLQTNMSDCFKFVLENYFYELNIFNFTNLQFTEEKLGQAEKTELDAHLENLLSKAECTKLWTEKIMKQTEVLLQPNPSKEPFRFLFSTFELIDMPM